MFQPDKLADLISEDRCARPAVEAAPFTVEDVTVWLETKDPAEEYCYRLIDNCLLGQYVNERGGKSIDSPRVYQIGGASLPCHFVGELFKHPLDYVATERPHTFGAALGRAREYAARAK